MIFRSAGELSTAAGALLPPHAVKTKIAVRTNNNGRFSRRIHTLLLNLDFAAHLWRPPFYQAVFKGGDDCLRYQRHSGEQEHPRENSVGVEVVLGAVDELSNSFGRSKQFADHGADQRQAEADVEARDDPAEGRGDDYLRGQPPVVRAEDARVGDEVALDLAHALKRIEEHDKEHEHRGGRDLR